MRKQSEVVTLYLKGLSRKEIAHATGKSYKNICEQLRRKGLPKPVQLRTVRDRTYTVYPYNDRHPQLVWPPLGRPYKSVPLRVVAVQQRPSEQLIQQCIQRAALAVKKLEAV